MLDFIKKRLGNKIMLAVTAGILLIMGVEIVLRLYYGTKDRMELLETASADLAAATYSGIKHPMSVGDSAAVEKVLADVRSKMAGIEVFICDASQQVIWSTHPERVHAKLAEVIDNTAALTSLSETLKTGAVPPAALAGELAGDRCIICIQPIHNEKECFHCHGASRQIIGGMVIRTNMERSMAAVSAARNRSILIMALGITAIIILIYALVEKFIRGPVEGLAAGVRKVADGDLNVAITSRASDEIGELARSFNRMTQQLKTARDELGNWTETVEELVEERTAQLKQAQASALQAEKMASMGRLAAIVAHEINNPLAGIRTYAKLLVKERSKAVAGSEACSIEYLRTIESEAARCGEIVRNLLQFARPAPPQFKRQDILTLIQGAVQLVQHKFQMSNISLRLDLDPTPLFVNCDEQKIKQALLALLLNGCDAVQPEIGVIEVRSRPRPEKGGVEIAIRDNGAGMDEETRAHMFEPFFTTKTRSQEDSPGTNIGLGLAVVYEIVKAHQGEITVDSELGIGSSITILLPLEPGGVPPV